MSRRILVALVDDLDGTRAEETIDFSLDGVSYHIDLSAANAEQLRGIFTRYLPNARRATRHEAAVVPVVPPHRPRAPMDREQHDAMRSWARRNGYPVSGRGRIPDAIAAAYHQHC